MTQFSPVAKSPGSKVSQQINLTGNPRIVRDLTATIHASVQQWNIVHLHGLSVLKAITGTKYDDGYPEELETLCENLANDCDKFDNIVSHLNQAAVQMNAIKLLHKGSGKLFQTWPVEYFGQTAELIFEAYKNEAEVKRKILENIAHDHRESWKMLHLAAWAYQAMISDCVTTALETMLVETGHR